MFRRLAALTVVRFARNASKDSGIGRRATRSGLGIAERRSSGELGLTNNVSTQRFGMLTEDSAADESEQHDPGASASTKKRGSLRQIKLIHYLHPTGLSARPSRC